MRLLFLILLLLSIFVQYPLWWGKGGWGHVKNLEQQVASQKQTIEALKARNAALSAEVVDLKSGTHAIEEKARAEQGMLKEDEIFVRIIKSPKATSKATE